MLFVLFVVVIEPDDSLDSLDSLEILGLARAKVASVRRPNVHLSLSVILCNTRKTRIKA